MSLLLFGVFASEAAKAVGLGLPLLGGVMMAMAWGA